MEFDAKMEEILKKLDLSAHSARFVEGKISLDIICKLSIEDFHNLVINDCNAIMALRIACSTFGSYTPKRGYHTNKFVIRKIFFRKFDSGRIYSERNFYDSWCFRKDNL